MKIIRIHVMETPPPPASQLQPASHSQPARVSQPVFSCYVYIYTYTYKTTLRVIRRLWGEGAQRFATSTHTSIAHRTIIVFTSSLHRYHINIASNIKFTTISYHYPINIATSSQRQHISITTMSHQYHIELLSNIVDITPI